MQYADTPRVNVIVQIPASMRDGLRMIAGEEGETVSVIVRRLITGAVRDKRPSGSPGTVLEPRAPATGKPDACWHQHLQSARA